MPTSLLYHGFGIQGYQHVRTKYHNGAIHFRVRQEVFSLCCPECSSHQVKRRGQVMRRFRTLPIGDKPVWIELLVQRVFCLLCGVLRQVKVNFASRRRSCTRAFARYALRLSRHMTIKDVARHLGVSWDLIKDMQKQHLLQRVARPKLHQLKQIAIDEISIGKGHRYLTVVLDLKSGAVVFVGDGKGAEALEPFRARLKRKRCAWKRWPPICRRPISARCLPMCLRLPWSSTASMSSSSIMTDCPICGASATMRPRT